MSVETIKETAQYLSFHLAEELFAIDIRKVREVIEFESVTKVPQTPDFVRGVINLGGGVVPVVDLKQKFGLGETEKTVNTCVIITEVAIEDEAVVLGAMADAVDEVFALSPESIELAPRIGTHLNTAFLKGMGKKEENFILILDIDRVFSLDELDLVQQTGAMREPDKEEEA